MTKNDAYTSQLIKIVFNSADVLPNEVIKYLKKVAVSNSSAVKIKILKDKKIYHLLIDYLPKEFVDCILDLLIKKPVKRKVSIPSAPPELSPELIKRLKSSGMTEEEIPLMFTQIVDDNDNDDVFEDFGIEEYNTVFLPSAPIQGPFFDVLNKNEDEGLRLVQTLTNSAVKTWRENQQKSNSYKQSLTPLPVTINLLSGEQKFWGDSEAYCWYRGTVNAPYSVMSSLMALEFWMEKQIEAGRSVEELFEKVLLGSECVAVLGICMSMALAYPNKCLKAILPIISNSAVWGMEIQRFVLEPQRTFSFPWRDGLVCEVIDERNKKSQRKLMVRNLVCYYLFSSDESIRLAFEQAIAEFNDNLPFAYLEEKQDSAIVADLQERIENYQAFGNRENYRTTKIGKQWTIQYESPEAIQKRNEEQFKPMFKQTHYHRLSMWAEKTIEQKKVSEEMTLEEATATAKKFQQPDDYSSTDEGEFRNNIRLRAIVGVATGILVADFEWVRTNNLETWSRDILLNAALSLNQEEARNYFPSGLEGLVGRGLGKIVELGIGIPGVREHLLLLVSNLKDIGIQAIFDGLYNAWTVDEVLCWNAFTLSLSLCIEARKLSHGSPVGTYGVSFHERDEWKYKLLNKHLNNLTNNRIPILPKIITSERVIFLTQKAQSILDALPCSELIQNYTDKSKILKLTDELLHWTIKQNIPDENRPFWDRRDIPRQWNRSFSLWLANLARFLDLEETRQHILEPIKNNCSVIPSLTVNLMEGYIHYHLATIDTIPQNSIVAWKEICNWVLDTIKPSQKFDSYSHDDGISDAVYLILFVRYGSSLLKNKWSHIDLFLEIIEKWVRVVNHDFNAYSCLLTMVEGIGWQFAPEPAIEWLSGFATAGNHQLWQENSNGERTAKLLQRIWQNYEQQIRKNSNTLKRYSNLVEQMIDAGIPLAAVLRQKLENHKGH